MNHPACTCIALLLLSSSCATLDIAEIEKLEREEFDPVMLSPASEIHNMRIDVIRQTYTSGSDSAGSTENTPYHPLGFDLGNGLFFDLNDNLTLRLDRVMNFASDSDFEVVEVSRPTGKGRATVYRFRHDSLTVTNIRKKNPRYANHLIVDGDSVRYMRKNRMKYAVVETDTSLVYTGKRRKYNAIYKADENRYYRDKEKKRNMYELTGNSILLGNTYVVTPAPDNLSIEIKQHRKRRNKLICTMVRDANTVIIYKKDFSGLKIERRGDGLDFTLNRKLVAHYEVR